MTACVRAYLAALAVAGAIDYPAESSRYGSLVAAEKANFNIDTYRAANAFEGDLTTRMVKAQGDAAMKAITLQTDRREAERSPPSGLDWLRSRCWARRLSSSPRLQVQDRNLRRRERSARRVSSPSP